MTRCGIITTLWCCGLMREARRIGFDWGRYCTGGEWICCCTLTLNIRIKEHLYKWQLNKMAAFTKQIIRDPSLEASSLKLTVSLIKYIVWSPPLLLGAMHFRQSTSRKIQPKFRRAFKEGGLQSNNSACAPHVASGWMADRQSRE